MDELVKGLSLVGAALKQDGHDINAHFAAGEIIGLAGLDGHGQEAFLEALAGLRPLARGKILLAGNGGRTAIAGFRSAAANGIAYLPRDRRMAGIFPNLSVLDNFAIASLTRDIHSLLISHRARRARFDHFQRRLSIVATDVEGSIARLSGGNQQKVLIARLLARDPQALLLNDPTRGVDVATRRVLYGVFRELAEAGMTIVILSSELEELIALCDRVLVFRDHDLVARLPSEGLTSGQILAAMFGKAA